MPQRNLKLLSFILLPITQILIPAITMIASPIILIPWFACISFCGYPLEPWRKIKSILGKVWEKFTSVIKDYAENRGKESETPSNWDGTVLGLAVDPLVIAIETSHWMWKLIELQYEFCSYSSNLCCCYFGFSFILIPLNIVYAGICVSIQATIAVIFVLIGLTQGVVFVIVGVWPSIILAIGITGITIVTLPMNIYYHALVTYR
jgi:hypothetical protein